MRRGNHPSCYILSRWKLNFASSIMHADTMFRGPTCCGAIRPHGHEHPCRNRPAATTWCTSSMPKPSAPADHKIGNLRRLPLNSRSLRWPDPAAKRHAQGPVLPTAIAKGRGRRCCWAVMRRGQPNRAPHTVTTEAHRRFRITFFSLTSFEFAACDSA